jgi:hypothetical protein
MKIIQKVLGLDVRQWHDIRTELQGLCERLIKEDTDLVSLFSGEFVRKFEKKKCKNILYHTLVAIMRSLHKKKL